jgi:hypothetical protein
MANKLICAESKRAKQKCKDRKEKSEVVAVSEAKEKEKDHSEL